MKVPHQSKGVHIQCVLASLMLLVLGVSAHAEEKPDGIHGNAFYVGAGQSDDGPNDSGSTPWTIGFMSRSLDRDYFWGLDAGGEGTKLDSTYRREMEMKQALSFNVLGGLNISNSATWRADVGLLLGMREETSDCPDSYVGYRCYADREPETDYDVNYGAILLFTRQKFVFGVRATGESTQVVLGWNIQRWQF